MRGRYKNEEVLEFIDGFKVYGQDVINLFSNGYCYWFASILAKRFHGTIAYNARMNHFACMIPLYKKQEGLYDITGAIDHGEWDDYISWSFFQGVEPLDADRIVRDCILKMDNSYEIDYQKDVCNGEKLLFRF